jgi:hypothetical protein
MHDILIALVFVGMVAYPAMVTAMPGNGSEDESGPALARVAAPANRLSKRTRSR